MAVKEKASRHHSTGRPVVQVLSSAEGRALFDQEARAALGMSGEEFVKAWNAGQFDDNPDCAQVMRVVQLLPLVTSS